MMLCIVDNYDKEDKSIDSVDDLERHNLYRWLFFQISGHGYARLPLFFSLSNSP